MDEMLNSIRKSIDVMSRDINWLTKAKRAETVLGSLLVAVTDLDNRLKALEGRNG